MKNSNLLFIGGALVLLLYLQSRSEAAPVPPGGEVPPPGHKRRILKLTSPPMKGEDIMEVQVALVSKKFPTKMDGVYGKNTAGAVMRFQKSVGLVPDGIVGDMTYTALGL